MGYCIYKICSNNIDYVYVGSTQNFTKRKYLHKSRCNNENSKHHNIKLYTTIRDNGGWENWRMVIIDEIGDVSKRQAEMKEEEWRVELQANLNMKRCYITEEQLKELNKEYRENNRDKELERHKEYYTQNRDKINEKNKEYYTQNRDKINEKNKEYYTQNRDKIVEYQKEYKKKNRDKIVEYQKEYQKEKYVHNRDKINEKITCECGCEIIKRCLIRHKKSKKHQAWEWRQTCLSA